MSIEDEARKQRAEAKATPGNFVRWFDGAWSFGLTFDEPKDHWGFSACLWPRGRSSELADWQLLGKWSRAIGMPEGCPCVGNTVETQANAIHKWFWPIEGRTPQPEVASALETLRETAKPPGRNEPCYCGSGKKFKKCCIDKPPTNYGPCEAVVTKAGAQSRCGLPSSGALECKFCAVDPSLKERARRYAYCRSHGSIVSMMMEGHIVRVHPEKVPEAMRKIAQDHRQLTSLRARAAESPEMWGRQLAEVEKYVRPS